MSSRLRSSLNQRAFRRGRAALSERFEESEELVVRTVSGGRGRGSGDAWERLFLEAQIGVDVDLRRFDGFMPDQSAMTDWSAPWCSNSIAVLCRST